MKNEKLKIKNENEKLKMGSKPCVGFSPFFFLSLREKYLFRKWLSKIIYIKKTKSP